MVWAAAPDGSARLLQMDGEACALDLASTRLLETLLREGVEASVAALQARFPENRDRIGRDHVWAESEGLVVSDHPEHCRPFQPVARFAWPQRGASVDRLAIALSYLRWLSTRRTWTERDPKLIPADRSPLSKGAGASRPVDNAFPIVNT